GALPIYRFEVWLAERTEGMSAADKAVFVQEAARARGSVWAAGSVLREIRAELGVGSGAEELSDPRVRARFFAEYQDELSGLWEHLGEPAKQRPEGRRG